MEFRQTYNFHNYLGNKNIYTCYIYPLTSNIHHQSFYMF